MQKQAIGLLSLGHFLIDFCQGVVPALVPFLVAERHFSYSAAASLVFAISATSSVVQPLFGQLADRMPMPWLLPASVALAGSSLALGAQATSYPIALLAFAFSGLGVAAYHPEAARKANIASGDQRTTGMSLFSVGGGLGFAAAPALTTPVVKAWSMTGLLALLVPTLCIAGLLAMALRLAMPPAHHGRAASTDVAIRDNWRAFAILSGATVCRSIVFYGLNTFLALYFMTRWHQEPDQANQALVVFLGTSIAGTLLGGWLADRFGRRGVLRTGFTGALVMLAIFTQTSDRTLALWLLVPLALFIFLPTSVLIVLGQEYLPHRVGTASGVTLGLAVSVGGMCAPLLGRLGESRGLGSVFVLLWVILLLAAGHTYALPPAGAGNATEREFEPAGAGS
jgi:MFS transporter, FSR family, fosmidomycin resistance protein